MVSTIAWLYTLEQNFIAPKTLLEVLETSVKTVGWSKALGKGCFFFLGGKEEFGHSLHRFQGKEMKTWVGVLAL